MKRVTDKLWISPHPAAADMDEMKKHGIVQIINNRPDGEEPGQPTAKNSAAAAGKLGMNYVHIPVVPGEATIEDVRAFQKACSAADGPVLAHCKTGTRSLTLFAIGEVLDGAMNVGEIDSLGRSSGVDLSGAKKWIAANT